MKLKVISKDVRYSFSVTLTSEYFIPFNQTRPYNSTLIQEFSRLELKRGMFSGKYNAKVRKLVRDYSGMQEVLLTPSCTAALELALIMACVMPGDEVVMPAWNFPSSALPVVNFGAKPVFVDVDRTNLSLDVNKALEAVTEKTKAIVWTNYGGSPPIGFQALQTIKQFANLILIEDNAHGFGVSVNGLKLGSIGDFSVQSYHETKNVQCGEGGSIAIKDGKKIERALIVSEKGTNRSQFLRGEVGKYEWVDRGGSFLLAEPLALVLLTEIERLSEIQEQRRLVYQKYSVELEDWFKRFDCEMPAICEFREISAHLFYILCPTETFRGKFSDYLRKRGIEAFFHYQELASSVPGKKYGETRGSTSVSKIASERLLRLPLWEMSEDQCGYVIDSIKAYKGR